MSIFALFCCYCCCCHYLRSFTAMFRLQDEHPYKLVSKRLQRMCVQLDGHVCVCTHVHRWAHTILYVNCGGMLKLTGSCSIKLLLYATPITVSSMFLCIYYIICIFGYYRLCVFVCMCVCVFCSSICYKVNLCSNSNFL